MTAQQQILYGSFAGSVELREDMVRRAAMATVRSMQIRNAIAVAATVAAILSVVELVAPMPWAGIQSLALTFTLGTAWLIAVVNVWCCRQRTADSQAILLSYVSRLPVR